MSREKIKVVIDTNVLISSLWGGKPGKIVELWDDEAILIVVSQQVLDEYFNVLNRFDLSEEDIEDLTILFANPNKTIIVEPKVKIHLIKVDPEDNKFLECALEGKTKFIISGDKHILDLKYFQDIRIVTASEFLNLANELPGFEQKKGVRS